MANYNPVKPFPQKGNREASVRNLCNVQSQYMASADYCDDPQKAQIRAQAVITVKELMNESTSVPFTPYLAMNYFDRYLSRMQLPLPLIEENDDQNLKLVVFCCFSLAWKMTDDEHFLYEALGRSGKWGFGSHKIMKMEKEILRVLEWKMRSLTPVAFIPFFNPRNQTEGQRVSTEAIAKVITETYEDVGFTKFKPSEIAAAVILNSVPRIKMVETDYMNSAAVEECRKFMRKKLESQGKAMNETEEEAEQLRLTWKEKADDVLPNPMRRSSSTDFDSLRYTKLKHAEYRREFNFRLKLKTIIEGEGEREAESDEDEGIKREAESDEVEGMKREAESDEVEGMKREAESDEVEGTKREAESDEVEGTKREAEPDQEGEERKREAEPDQEGEGIKREAEPDQEGEEREKEAETDEGEGREKEAETDEGERREREREERGGGDAEAEEDADADAQAEGTELSIFRRTTFLEHMCVVFCASLSTRCNIL